MKSRVELLREAVKRVFAKTRPVACIFLAVTLGVYVIAADRVKAMAAIAIGMLLVALIMEAVDRRANRSIRSAAMAR